MKKRWLLTIGLCLLIGTSGFSQVNKSTSKTKTDLNEAIKLNSTVRYGKLANGMTYYIKQNKKPENRAEFQIAVNAGSVLESDAQLGLAHFTEHMGFNGTKQFPGNTLTDALQKQGITFGRDDNAYTAFDQTVYTLTLPTDKPELFDMGLKVLDGWASGMLMTDKEINDERGVIIEEWRLGQGADDRLRKKTWPIMLKGSKYADRLPIGTLENLQTFKPETIRDFYRTWYRPDNQALIIVGDFDADEMEQKVKDFFSMTPCPSTPLNRPVYSIPDNKEPLIAIATDKEATSNTIMLFYKHPSQVEKTVGDFRQQELVSGLYETMLNDRLREMTEKKTCPFIGAQAGYTPSFIARTVGGYISEATAKEGKVLQSLETMMTENQRVLQHGFLASELKRAKEALLDRYEQAAKEANKTESSTLAAQYVNNFLEQTPCPGARQEYRWAKDLIDGITLDEVNQLASKWITKDNVVVYVTMPEKKGNKVPTEKDIQNILNKMSNVKTTPYVDTYKEMPFLVNQPKAGKVTSKEENKEFGYTTMKLSNGATVILKPSTLKDNEILLSAWSKGGLSLYPDNKVLNGTFAASIIDACGIGNYNNSQLQKFLQGKTIGITPSIGELSEGLSGSCAPKDLETFFQYLYMYFDCPRKDKEVLDAKVSALQTQINALKNSPEFAFQIQMQKSMRPNDKRTIQIPTEKQLKELNIDEMYKIFRERFSNASDFTFEFVGNFSIDSITPLIEKYIGGIASKNSKENWKDVSAKFATGMVNDVVYKGTEDKSMIVLANEKDFSWNEKDKKAVDIMGEILQIKVTEKLREELGATYSPYLGVDYSKYPTPKFNMIAYYTCAPANLDKVEKATWDVVDAMINQGPSEADVNKAKEQLIRRREASYTSSNNFWLGVIQSSIWYEQPISNMETYKNSVNAITAADVKAAAAKYLSHNTYVKVTLKPETAKKK
ncbi:MAG: insulinase family protein [Bacteroidales bacterium]|jgi:zinc protease|nr:insulinase family protein [Bacteroidales bacterium]